MQEERPWHVGEAKALADYYLDVFGCIFRVLNETSLHIEPRFSNLRLMWQHREVRSQRSIWIVFATQSRHLGIRSLSMMSGDTWAHRSTLLSGKVTMRRRFSLIPILFSRLRCNWRCAEKSASTSENALTMNSLILKV